MLVLIGRNWVDAKDEAGRLRLQNPEDYVRLEVEAALKRNIPVTPVLVQGAQMPAPEQLPGEIKDLTYRNGFELSHNRWGIDVGEMMRRLGLDIPQTDRPRFAPQHPLPAGPRKSKQWNIWFPVLGFIVLACVGIGAWRIYWPHPNEQIADGYVALARFDEQKKTYPNFIFASGTTGEATSSKVIS